MKFHSDRNKIVKTKDILVEFYTQQNFTKRIKNVLLSSGFNTRIHISKTNKQNTRRTRKRDICFLFHVYREGTFE